MARATETKIVAMGAGIPEGDPEALSLTVDDEERRRRIKIEKSRSVDGMKERWRQQDREELEKAREANAPPVISEPKCFVCQSPHRMWIETQLMRGGSYTAIARSVPENPVTGKKIDRRSVANHYDQHMGYENAIVRGVLEEEATLLGQNVAEGIAGAFSMRGALHVLIRKAYDDALAGLTTVEPRDLIQLVKLFNEMDSSSSVKLVEEAKAAVGIFDAAIKNVIADMFDREQGDEIKRAMVKEIQRLREQSEIEAQLEQSFRVLPKGD